MATGRLRSAVGQTTPNPPYQMPMKTLGGITAQRRLRATAGVRPDLYSLHEPDTQEHESRKRSAEAATRVPPRKRRRQELQGARAYREQELAFADPYEEEIKSSGEQLRQEAIGDAQLAKDTEPQGMRRSPRKTRSSTAEGSQGSPTASRQAPAAISVEVNRVTATTPKRANDGGLSSIEVEAVPDKSAHSEVSRKKATTGAEQKSVDQSPPRRGRGRPNKAKPVRARTTNATGNVRQTTEHRTQRRSTRLQQGDVFPKYGSDDQASNQSTFQHPATENLSQPLSGKLKAPKTSGRLRSRPSRPQDDIIDDSLASTLHTIEEVENGTSQNGGQNHANNTHDVNGVRTREGRAESPLFMPAQDTEQTHRSSQSTGQRTARNNAESAAPNGQDAQRAASESDDVAGDELADDFYGQWQYLRLAVRRLADVGVNLVSGEPQAPNAIEMRDKRTKKLRRVCRQATEKFKSLCESGDLENDPIEELKRLRGIVDDFKQDDPDRVLKSTSVDLHKFVIPATVRVLQNMVGCYMVMDKDRIDLWHGPLTISHLREVTELMNLIVDLGKHMSACTRPPTEFAIRKPIKGVLIHITEALHGLHKVVRSHDSYQAAAADRARWQAWQTQQEERSEAHRRQRHEAFQVRRKWASLHEERIAAEGGLLCLTRAKMRHLLLPVSSYVWSVDIDGNVFSREELITTRAGPLPEHVHAARSQKWSLVQLDALASGLRKHQGQFVFEKIFREHCQRKVGILVDYSVTEIVTTASDLRDKLLREQGQPGAVSGGWIESIPVWVRPRGPGAENLAGR